MYKQILCSQIAWLIEVRAEENTKKFIRKDYDYDYNYDYEYYDHY